MEMERGKWRARIGLCQRSARGEMSYQRREWPALLAAVGHDSFGSCYVCASLTTPTRPYAAVSGRVL